MKGISLGITNTIFKNIFKQLLRSTGYSGVSGIFTHFKRIILTATHTIFLLPFQNEENVSSEVSCSVRTIKL